MSYRYFNKNTAQVAEFDNPSTRLEYLQNWVTVEDDAHLAELQAGRDVRTPGLLGSSKVVQQDPPSTPEPDPPHPPPSTDPQIEPETTPTPDPPAPDPEPEIKGPDPSRRPSKTATKAQWVDWAEECGAERDEAQDMTKQDLIDIYG